MNRPHGTPDLWLGRPGSRTTARLVAALALAALWLPPAPSTAETSADEAALFERLTAREQILDAQRSAALTLTRQRSLLAYRLARRRELGFSANPDRRLDDARAFNLALLALRRSAAETLTLSTELDRVRVERGVIEDAFLARATADSPGSPSTVASLGRLFRPVRGEIVAVPGTRRDGPTKVELRHDEVVMLARLNEPVRAIAAGTVKRVEALPQGGFAVVTAHAAGLTSILTGLRDIAVTPGEQVEAGAPLGLAGRNLDGAAVVSVEIWRDRRPQDVARLLRGRSGS
jgi:murein DD-endopeptidase MepM/ murein hydrolase activator NlpD